MSRFPLSHLAHTGRAAVSVTYRADVACRHVGRDPVSSGKISHIDGKLLEGRNWRVGSVSGHHYRVSLGGLICLLVKQTQLPLIPLVWRSGPGGEGVVDSPCGPPAARQGAASGSCAGRAWISLPRANGGPVPGWALPLPQTVHRACAWWC